MIEDYRGIKLVLIDAGPALINACDNTTLAWRRCSQHICKNLHTEFPGLPKDFDNQVYLLARATTEVIEKAQLEKMRKEFPNYGGAVDWLEERLSQFVSRYFLDRGIHNFTMISNNASEQSWKFLKPARSLPVISMLERILELFVEKGLREREIAFKRRDDASKFTATNAPTRLSIVPVVEEDIKEAISRIVTKDVRFSSLDGNCIQAVVQLSKKQKLTARVVLRKNPFIATCSYCSRLRDTGYMCDCMIAAVQAASKKLPNDWSPYAATWFHQHWLMAEWLRQKEVIPIESNFMRSDVAQDDPHRLLPWEIQPSKPGRKKGGARTDKEKDPPTKRPGYSCGGCGELGHNISKCTKVNLDYWRRTLLERENGVKSKKKMHRVDLAGAGEGQVEDCIRDAGVGFLFDALSGISTGALVRGRGEDSVLAATHDHLGAIALSMGLVESTSGTGADSFFSALSDQLFYRREHVETAAQV